MGPKAIADMGHLYKQPPSPSFTSQTMTATTSIAMAATPPAPPAHGGRNGTTHPSPSTESFSKFFESWIAEQARDLAELRAAAAADRPATPDADLRRLVDRVLGHYDHYYRTKRAAAADDVLRMFTPSWTSTTENLYLWCGGWRPTAALHLLYAKSGIQLEHQLPNFLNGGGLVADLGDLTADQLEAADQLQRRTIKREREIEDAAASAQVSPNSKIMINKFCCKNKMDLR